MTNDELRNFAAAFIEANPEKFPDAHLALAAQRRRYEGEVERLENECGQWRRTADVRAHQITALERDLGMARDRAYAAEMRVDEVNRDYNGAMNGILALKAEVERLEKALEVALDSDKSTPVWVARVENLERELGEAREELERLKADIALYDKKLLETCNEADALKRERDEACEWKDKYENGREFAVIGTTLYEIDSIGTLTSRGTVAPGDDPATISSNGDLGNQLFITSGGNGYYYDLTTDTLTQVAALNGLADMGADGMGADLYWDGHYEALVAEVERLKAFERQDREIRAALGWKRDGRELPELVRGERAKIEAALALHQKRVEWRGLGHDIEVCTCGVEWPCPTYEALTGGRE